jgi:hypothetical protein
MAIIGREHVLASEMGQHSFLEDSHQPRQCPGRIILACLVNCQHEHFLHPQSTCLKKLPAVEIAQLISSAYYLPELLDLLVSEVDHSFPFR